MRRTDTFGDFQFAYHYGSVVSPYIRFDEPLRVECQHFVDCVGRRRPAHRRPQRAEVVRVIEAAQQSLRRAGSRSRYPRRTTRPRRAAR